MACGKSRGRCGLYFALAGRKQELQERPDALGPRCFVVLAAFCALVVQVVTLSPALLHEYVSELFNLMHDARAFACADIEPDPRARLNDGSLRKSVHHVLVPPD